MNHRLRYLAAILMMAFPASVQAANQWSHARRLTVVMVDNHFQPDHLIFQTGHPYDLRLENHGRDLHEFTAPAFLKSASVADKRLLANGGTDDGAPGVRPESFGQPYIAYLRDPDGNKICAMWKSSWKS